MSPAKGSEKRGVGYKEQIKNCAKLTPGGYPKEAELYEGDHHK